MSTTASISFLSKDACYEHEKPYSLKFAPPMNLPKSNVKGITHDQVLEDVRGHEEQFDIEKHGFAIVSIPEALSYEEYDDDENIREIYLPQIARLLQHKLGASRVQIFEHLIRRRHTSFPIATGEAYQHYQPTTTAHIDMTQEWARKMAGRLNHKIGIHVLPSQNYQFINVWKPLRGPIRDWPLALCDPSTVQKECVIPGDVIFEDMEMENILLHHDSKQKWLYISDQQPNEAWVFVQGDNRNGVAHKYLEGVPHTSFCHRDYTVNDQPRESIEVRALVFYDI